MSGGAGPVCSCCPSSLPPTHVTRNLGQQGFPVWSLGHEPRWESADSGLTAQRGQSWGHPAVPSVPAGEDPRGEPKESGGAGLGRRGVRSPLAPDPNQSPSAQKEQLSAMEGTGGRRGGRGSLYPWERRHLPSETSPDGRPAWKEVRGQPRGQGPQALGHWVRGRRWDEGLRSGTGWCLLSHPQPSRESPHWDRAHSGQRPRLPGSGRAGLSCHRLRQRPAPGRASRPSRPGHLSCVGVGRDTGQQGSDLISQEPHRQPVSLCPAAQTRADPSPPRPACRVCSAGLSTASSCLSPGDGRLTPRGLLPAHRPCPVCGSAPGVWALRGPHAPFP